MTTIISIHPYIKRRPIAIFICTPAANVQTGEKTFNIPPGEHETFTIRFTCPRVDSLTSGQFRLTAQRKGEVVFTDSKDVRILAPAGITLKGPGKGKPRKG
mgnify:CR=1 FL=1